MDCGLEDTSVTIVGPEYWSKEGKRTRDKATYHLDCLDRVIKRLGGRVGMYAGNPERLSYPDYVELGGKKYSWEEYLKLRSVL